MDRKTFETLRGLKELKQLASVWNFHQIEIGIENVSTYRQRANSFDNNVFYSIIKLNQHLKTISFTVGAKQNLTTKLYHTLFE